MNVTLTLGPVLNASEAPWSSPRLGSRCPGYGAARLVRAPGRPAQSQQPPSTLVSWSVKTLKVAGDDVGGVAVYRVKPGLAKRPTFSDSGARKGRVERPPRVRA